MDSLLSACSKFFLSNRHPANCMIQTNVQMIKTIDQIDKVIEQTSQTSEQLIRTSVQMFDLGRFLGGLHGSSRRGAPQGGWSSTRSASLKAVTFEAGRSSGWPASMAARSLRRPTLKASLSWTAGARAFRLLPGPPSASRQDAPRRIERPPRALVWQAL